MFSFGIFHKGEQQGMAFTEFCGPSGAVLKQKTAVWNAFVKSELSHVTEDDCAIFPRILPREYLPVIERTARDITEFVLRLVSLPEREVRAIIPSGPIRDFLIDELNVLRHRSGRMTGSFRFDMALVGEPHRLNPPKLLEINEIGFDGLARSSFIQQTLFNTSPGLRRRAFALDAANAEIRNMQRLGESLVRWQNNCYDWDEEFLLRRAAECDFQLSLVAPNRFRGRVGREFPLLKRERVSFVKGRLRVGRDFFPAASQISFALALKDYVKNGQFFGELVRSKTPQYGPFVMGLVASKMILVLLNDWGLRRWLLGTRRRLSDSLLDSFPLTDRRTEVLANSEEFVLKHTDSFGGKKVFIGPEIEKHLTRIRVADEKEWVVQRRTQLNVVETEGILSGRRKLVTDLGVFVQYDWARGRMLNFELGGFISRGTNRGLKVNVSGGGMQVPVMFHKR